MSGVRMVETSGHLPECPCTAVGMPSCICDDDEECGPQCRHHCICDRLRACEARVLSVAGPHNYTRGRKDGYAAALSAARDAVDSVPLPDVLPPTVWQAWIAGNAASLAAIDALRGSGNPDTPPSAEKGEQA